MKLGGVVTPLFALRGENDHGVGDTEALKEVIDWAAAQELRLVQLLPVNETGGDHSPYNIISSLAIEPSTLATCPETLPDLSPEDYQRIVAKHDLTGLKTGSVDYAGVKKLKRELFEAAWKSFQAEKNPSRQKAFEDFRQAHRSWIETYGFYRALVSLNGESELLENWDAALRSHTSAREWVKSAGLQRKVKDRAEFHIYVQWIAYSQWRGVREYADSRGVALMGDIPVGVSLYSADVFEDASIFDLTRSSGAPPERVFKEDPFTMKWGQNWGFPLYRWEAMARDNYAWWRRRIAALRDIFHFLRVDHALGFFRIYSFPWRPERNVEFLELTKEEALEKTGGRMPCFIPRDDSSEENRALNREQGETLFRMLLEETQQHRLIAEDLGEVAPYVRPVLRKLGIPGFKIPQWERGPDGKITPGSEYERLSITAYATHDHAPIRTQWNEWWRDSQSGDGGTRWAGECAQRDLLTFAGMPDMPVPCEYSFEIQKTLLEGLFRSNSWLAVPMITDVFGLEDRFNVPGVSGEGNWTRRLDVPVKDWQRIYGDICGFLRDCLQRTGRTVS